MQRLGLTTDHRDLVEQLADVWTTATADNVICHREMGNINLLVMQINHSAARLDDTVRHATTVLKTGATSPTALRQRRDLDRLYRDNVIAFPANTNERRSDCSPNDAA